MQRGLRIAQIGISVATALAVIHSCRNYYLQVDCNKGLVLLLTSGDAPHEHAHVPIHPASPFVL